MRIEDILDALDRIRQYTAGMTSGEFESVVAGLPPRVPLLRNLLGTEPV